MPHFVGWSDVPADLSDAAKIARLNAHLPDDAIVISSDLIRCTATAETLVARRELLAPDADLREMHFGEWELQPFSEIQKTHPQLSRDFWSNPGDVAPPNGESWNETATRVEDAVQRITKKYQGRNIIAVAHFGVILTQIARAADIRPKSAINFKIDNLSVTRIEDLGDTRRVLGVNHQP